MRKLSKVLPLLLLSLTLTSCTEQTKPEQAEPEPIEVVIPEPARYGFVMMRTPEGENIMYSTNIEIQNDGKDGTAIYIVIDEGVVQW